MLGVDALHLKTFVIGISKMSKNSEKIHMILYIDKIFHEFLTFFYRFMVKKNKCEQ